MCATECPPRPEPVVNTSKSRSVWFWQEIGNPYGASNIVGNNVLENQTVAFLQSRAM